MTLALRAEIESFLDAYSVLSLATLADGEPHAASLFYARDGLDLFWTSDAKTRHSLALEAAGPVSATVAPDYRDFREIRGLQIAGTAVRLVDEAARAHAQAVMEARYPFLQTLASGPPALQAAYAAAGFYVLRPRRIVFIDNSKGFGHKAILDV